MIFLFFFLLAFDKEKIYNKHMNISGVIDNIVYRNEENGYTIAKLQTDDGYFTVVGKFLMISVGENVNLSGQITHNARFGAQFEFENYEIFYPTTISGIEKYLGSGLIKGVGPITAKAIVNEFKKDTLYTIEFTPEKLSKVKGVSEKKAVIIGESFQTIKKMQNAVMFLQNYNITTNMAMKIFEIYQEKTVEMVRENPYRLVEDIDGIGFLTADNIAKNMGVNFKSDFRIRAGILYIINQNSEKTGNTYNYKKAIISQTASLLLLGKEEEELFEKIIEDLIRENIVKCFFYEQKEILMLTKFFFLEKSIAQKLTLLHFMQKNKNINVEKEIFAFEMINKLTFHTEQKNAIDMAINSGVSVITGGPGTGKTTLVKCMIKLLLQMNKKIMLLAPTGRASKRLNESTSFPASTIHRALDLDFRGGNGKGFFTHNESNPLETDFVIVDEMSMVDASLMNALLKALPRNCQLVLVGDKDQLASVGAGNVLHDILQANVFPVTYLTKIYRQDEKSMIITNAHLINEGEMPIIDNTSTDFFFEQKETNDEIAQSIIELATKRIANFTGKDFSSIQILAPLKLGVCGTNNLNHELQKKLNPDSLTKTELIFGQTVFREGDKVMHIVNNYNLVWKKTENYITYEGNGVFNGDIGYINKIDRLTGETLVWFDDGRECVYSKNDISQLVHAYAITVHKSQGSEFDIVIIPIIAGAKMILTRNLIYTAVTRAKEMVVLVGQKGYLKRMITNNYTAIRLTFLKQFLLDSFNDSKKLFGE